MIKLNKSLKALEIGLTLFLVICISFSNVIASSGQTVNIEVTGGYNNYIYNSSSEFYITDSSGTMHISASALNGYITSLEVNSKTVTNPYDVIVRDGQNVTIKTTGNSGASRTLMITVKRVVPHTGNIRYEAAGFRVTSVSPSVSFSSFLLRLAPAMPLVLLTKQLMMLLAAEPQT